MKRSLAVFAGVILVSCTEVAAPPSSQFREVRAPNSALVATYTAIDLGWPVATFGDATAINEAGQIAGFGDKADGTWGVFRWQAGVLTALPGIGGSYSYAPSINANGDMAGWSYLADNSTYHAALWTGTTVTHVGTLPGDAGSYATDLNDHGQVVGVSWGAINRAFIWQAGVMTELPGLTGSHYNNAVDINNSGDVVGDSREQAVLWHNGAVTMLTKLQPSDEVSGAIGINEAGQIAGYSGAAVGYYHAVRWTNGVPTDLGDLGGGRSTAKAINTHGDVVGWSSLPDGNTHAFLWRNGSMIDLGDLGYPYSIATDINDEGQVAGLSYLPDGHYRAFLWENGVMTDMGTLGGNSSIVRTPHVLNNHGQLVGASNAADGLEHPTLWDPNTVTTVSIDIKPGSTPNSVNPKAKGVIPVAVLSVGGFDATTIDVSTVKFGPNGAGESHGKGHIEDANGDGVPDMVLHFDTQASGITCGTTSATLTGKTVGGKSIKGSDAVVTVSCK